MTADRLFFLMGAISAFIAVAAGSGPLAFADAHGYDAAGRVPTGVAFAAGSVVYQP